MPQYMVSDGHQMPKFARVDNNGKKIVWVDIEDATGFGSPETARAAFENGVAAMIEAARAAAVRAIESNKINLDKNGRWARPKKNQWELDTTVEDPAELFSLEWSWRAKDGLSRFPVAARPTKEDLLGVFETFYIHSPQRGWLCRPQRKSEEGRLGWNQSFALAVPFSSEADARYRLGQTGQPGSVVKTSCVFTQVLPVGSSRAQDDDTTGMIAAACEARDIKSAIEQSAMERVAALRQVERLSENGAVHEKSDEKPRRAPRL